MIDTPIDAAHRAMEAAPEDAAPRLRFHERVMDAELFLLLESEPDGDTLSPQVFDIDEGRFVLAFDRDDRLAEFLDAEAVAWMAAMGEGSPDNLDAVLRRVSPPDAAPEALIAAIGAKLAAMSTRVASAHLVSAGFDDRPETLLLALGGVAPEARAAVAAAIAEAVRFSGLERGVLDVTFLAEDAPALLRIRAAGLTLDQPRPVPREPSTPKAPGSDPDRPPILR